jgi:integrase
MLLNRGGKAETTQQYHREIIGMIRRKWRDSLPKLLTELTPDDVDRFAMRAGHYSASRWNGMLTVLHAVTPLSHRLRRRDLKLTRKPPPTPQQFDALMTECSASTRSCVRLVTEFLGHSGLRITAARRVRWTDVHTDRIEYTGKGGRQCSVPIIPGMRRVLADLKAIHDGKGFVLPRSCVLTALRNACDRAGLRRMNHHDFRHMFATRCIESGVDVPTVARWLGHKDGGALLSKRYFHLLDGHSRTMAARVVIAA